LNPDLVRALTPCVFIGAGFFLGIGVLFANTDSQTKVAIVGLAGTAIGCAGGLSRNVPDSQNSISPNEEDVTK